MPSTDEAARRILESVHDLTDEGMDAKGKMECFDDLLGLVSDLTNNQALSMKLARLFHNKPDTIEGYESATQDMLKAINDWN